MNGTRRNARRFIRLLPATLIAVTLLLTVRVGELWRGVDIGPATVAIAETEKPEAGHDVASGQEAHADAAHGDSHASDDHASDEAALIEMDRNFTEEEIAVLLDLAKRRDELEARESEIESRTRLLDAAEARIDKRIAEMEELRATLQSLVRQYDEQEKTELDSVVKIYESMKSKDAARILEELSLPVLMGIMEKMKERKTAEILAAMKAERARLVTAELARRREVDLSRMSGSASGG